jgi:maltose phosphorylase
MQHKDQLTKMVLGPYVPHTSNKLMFCNAFISLKNISKEELKRNFEFYESFTVHESSFSMCTFHTSCFIRQDGHGLYFYLRTSRLDLDDYNKEVEEGCHITSMAGTMSIVEGFGGMRVKTTLNFSPKIPKQWKGYSFKVNFRNQIITVSITHFETTFQWTELKT